MPNERLRRAIREVGLTPDDLAELCEVDPKTVQRWVTKGRRPHVRHQVAAAGHVRVPVDELWPDNGETNVELIELFPFRAAVPRDTWLRLLASATEHVDVLAWAATFFHQLQPWIARMLVDAASRGAQVRMCFADPSSSQLRIREVEEPLLGPSVLANKVRVSLGYYRDLVDVPGVEIRLHSAVVYASLFRYDEEIVVNPHVYGRPASENPALHLRRGPLFEAYSASFDEVWKGGRQWRGEEV